MCVRSYHFTDGFRAVTHETISQSKVVATTKSLRLTCQRNSKASPSTEATNLHTPTSLGNPSNRPSDQMQASIVQLEACTVAPTLRTQRGRNASEHGEQRHGRASWSPGEEQEEPGET